MGGFLSSESAVILLVLSAIAVGVVSAVVTTWSLRARLYSLEDRLNVVEGVTQREVKIRAAQSRPAKLSADEVALNQLAALQAKPATFQGPWWMNPKLKRGGVESGTVR